MALSFMFILCIILSGGLSAISLFSNPSFEVDGLPFCATRGDLNRDGRDDLIVCSMRENSALVVLLGKGDGTFEPLARTILGSSVNWLLAVDVTEDDLLDAIAVQDDRVLVLRGKGDGTLHEPISLILEGHMLHSASIADLNHDGHLDLVTPNWPAGSVEVSLGRGDGSFFHFDTLAAGSKPSAVATGDFDGDGHPDVAAWNVASRDLSILRGRGDAMFEPDIRLAQGGYQPALDYGVLMVAGDLNGDSRDDLVLSKQGTNEIVVMFGAKQGGLTPSGVFRSGEYPLTPLITDLNGDQSPDIIVGSYASDDVTVLLGDGQGAFGATQVSGLCSGPGGLTLGRFDGDEWPDLAAACRGTFAVSIFRGNGDGTFGTHVLSMPATDALFMTEINILGAGDFDGDSRSEAVVAASSSDRIFVMFFDHLGVRRSTAEYEVGWHPTSLAVGHFNEDQFLDLAVVIRDWDPGRDGPIACPGPPPPDTPRGEVVLLLGNGDGSLRPSSRTFVGQNPSDLKTMDFDADGLDDLVVANLGKPRTGKRGYVSLLRGRSGTFEPERQIIESLSPHQLAIADFNGDGIQDIVVADRGTERQLGDVAVLPGAGKGAFASKLVIQTEWSGGCIAAEDLDHDGRSDLVVADPRGRKDPYSGGETRIHFGQDDGLPTHGKVQPGARPLCAATGDFDGNGKHDLLILNAAHDFSILLGSGRTFSTPTRFSTPGPATRLVPADVNGDGRSDVVSGLENGVGILLSRESSEAPPDK